MAEGASEATGARLAAASGAAGRSRRAARLGAVALGMALAAPWGRAAATAPQIPRSLRHHKQTEHFEIHTDLDRASLRYYECVFEGFAKYFEQTWLPLKPKSRLTILLFKDAAGYQAHVREVSPGYERTMGFYDPDSDTIFVNRSTGLGTATHEMAHYFIRVSFARRPPAWVNEGFAAFFEKFIGYLRPDGSLAISFGYFSNWRFPKTKARVATLDLVQLARFGKMDGDDQCPARALMLFLHKKRLLKPFIERMAAGPNDPDGLTTLAAVYGKPIAEIQREWKAWIRSQPIDDEVKLVPAAFVKTPAEWADWWRDNGKRLRWSKTDQVYHVRRP